MDKESLDMTSLDKKNRGTISVGLFTELVTDELQLNLKDLRDLIVAIKDDDDQKFLSSEKLQRYFDILEQADQLQKELNDMVQNGDAKVNDIFYEYDQNENDALELNEFSVLIKTMNPKARQKPIDTLF